MLTRWEQAVLAYVEDLEYVTSTAILLDALPWIARRLVDGGVQAAGAPFAAAWLAACAVARYRWLLGEGLSAPLAGPL